MAVVKDVYAPKPANVANVAKKEAISEVQQAANEIDVVASTKKKAEDLAGLSGVVTQRDSALLEAQQSRNALEQDRQNTLKNTIESLGKQIGETAAEDKGHIRELQAELKATNAELLKTMMDGLTSKIEGLERMKGEQAAPTDIAKQVKGIKEAFTELGLANTQQLSNTMPPEMVIQMKKMDFDMQTSIEDRADERSRRDKEWQLQVRKWDQEKEDRHNEFSMKIAAERERNGMLMGAVNKVGAMVAQATVASPQGGVSSDVAEEVSKPRVKDIQVAQGEAGMFPCADCQKDVPVAEDAVSAVCANCGMVYRVHRSAPAEQEDEGARAI